MQKDKKFEKINQVMKRKKSDDSFQNNSILNQSINSDISENNKNSLLSSLDSKREFESQNRTLKYHLDKMNYLMSVDISLSKPIFVRKSQNTNKNKDERNEYQDILKNNYDNECHTENRYNCYEKDKEEKEKELKNKIVNGHLFYNSVPCAKKVLDGEYLGIRKMIIAFGILFTLI